MADGSIFSSIMDYITPLEDNIGSALTKAIGGSTASNANAQSQSDYRAERLSNMLNAGKFPMSIKNDFPVTKSKAPESVDPQDIQNQWLRRLGTYSQLTSYVGGK